MKDGEDKRVAEGEQSPTVSKKHAFSKEQLDFVGAAREEARAHRNAAIYNEDGTEREEVLDSDGKFIVGMPKDEMVAWGYLIPPTGEGALPTLDHVMAQISGKGINHGLIDMAELWENPPLSKLIIIAEGDYAVNGIDGTVEDLFERERKMHLKTNSDNTIDFKQLGLLQQVAEGEVICRMTYPTPPQDGMTVRGKELKGTPGKMPKIPRGKLVGITEDESALIAECGGQVRFIGDSFHVEQVLTINGNVDNACGNLDVIGNLVVTGNLLSGFSVKATKDIKISGLAEGANIEAGGNVTIGLGMNGGYKGTIKAGGNVVSKFLENCTVESKANIIAESIVNCTASADDSVIVSKGHGVIIGGVITAMNIIEAKSIGNELNRATELVIGSSPEILSEIDRLTKETKALENNIDENEKSIVYLNSIEDLPEQRQKLINDLQLKLKVDKMQHAQKNKKLSVLIEQRDNADCQILVGTAYPSTSIKIGAVRMILQRTEHKCRIYLGEDGIRIGIL